MDGPFISTGPCFRHIHRQDAEATPKVTQHETRRSDHRDGTHVLLPPVSKESAGGITMIGGALFGDRPLVRDLYKMFVMSQVCNVWWNS